jgi:hypothetical protein
MGAVRKKKEGGAKAPLTYDDQLREEAIARTLKAVGKHLWSIGPKRPIESLTELDVTMIVETCLAEWIVVRCEQARRDGLTPRQTDELILSMVCP